MTIYLSFLLFMELSLRCCSLSQQFRHFIPWILLVNVCCGASRLAMLFSCVGTTSCSNILSLVGQVSSIEWACILVTLRWKFLKHNYLFFLLFLLTWNNDGWMLYLHSYIFKDLMHVLSCGYNICHLSKWNQQYLHNSYCMLVNKTFSHLKSHHFFMLKGGSDWGLFVIG